MTVPSPQDIHASVDAAFGPKVEREVTTFSSGAVAISIRDRGHAAFIDGTADGEWGVSVDPDEAAAMTGHDTVTSSLAQALDLARSMLRGS